LPLDSASCRQRQWGLEQSQEGEQASGAHWGMAPHYGPGDASLFQAIPAPDAEDEMTADLARHHEYSCQKTQAQQHVTTGHVTC